MFGGCQMNNEERIYKSIKRNEKRLIACWYDANFLSYTILAIIGLIVCLFIQQWIGVALFGGSWIIIGIVMQVFEKMEMNKVQKEENDFENGN